MLKMLSDILLAADSQKVTLLALLDLSAAFDCIDHDILLHSFSSSLVLAAMAAVISDRQNSTGFV